MYMNFGWTGVVVISFLVGVFAAFIWSRFANRKSSPAFAAALVLLSPLFFPESNLSMQLGGLFIVWPAIISFCWLIHLYFGGATRIGKSGTKSSEVVLTSELSEMPEPTPTRDVARMDGAGASFTDSGRDGASK